MAYGKEFSSAQKKNVPLLDKYRCRICEKWKESASYSKKELSTYTYKVGNGTRLNGITANLRCRVCSGGAVTEKQCEGACKMWKDLQQFSKSARSNGGSQCCMACTVWVETQEPGMVTQAPPTGDYAAAEDDDDDHWTATATYSDPEVGDSDSDYEDFARTTTSKTDTRSSDVSAPPPGTRKTPSVVTSTVHPLQHIEVPYNALAGVSLNGTNNTSNPGTGRTTVTGNPTAPTAPTTSGARVPPGSALLSGSGTASGVGSRNALNQAQFDLRSQSSASNPYEKTSSTKGPAWGAVDARRRPLGKPVNYTGWDNRGQPHAQQRFPSGSGSHVQVQPSTSSASNSAPVIAPAPPAAVQSARNSSWAKPVGSRLAPRLPGAAGSTPLAEARPDEASDSEDDLYNM